MTIEDQIFKLKKEKEAIIVSHYYMDNRIHKISDIIGDSYQLAKKVQNIKAKIILVAGVIFMAEMVKVLNPRKKVLIPTLTAECEMVNMCSVGDIKLLKKQHPHIPVVAYINTSVEVKAISDICCTSSNVLAVINSLNSKEVIFVPDENLGTYASYNTNKLVRIPKSFCYVHKEINTSILNVKLSKYPKAKVIVHPECNIEIQNRADFIGSTGSMIEYIKNDNGLEYLIGTENDFVEYLKIIFPEKSFYSLAHFCKGMKAITLSNIHDSLLHEKFVINIKPDLRKRALKSLKKMLNYA